MDGVAHRSTCELCGKPMFWVNEQPVWPPIQLGPPASEDLTDEEAHLYDQARQIAAISPAAGAGMLRLVVELLVSSIEADLGRSGETDTKAIKRRPATLADRIQALADSGRLDAHVIAAMDAARLTGNQAVHEGQIDLAEHEPEAVFAILLTIVNNIVTSVRTMPRQVATVLDRHEFTPRTVADREEPESTT